MLTFGYRLSKNRNRDSTTLEQFLMEMLAALSGNSQTVGLWRK